MLAKLENDGRGNIEADIYDAITRLRIPPKTE
jgi:hypothetical protein